MRKITALVLACLIMATGCTYSENIGGVDVPCVGLGEEENPKYRYDVHAWNVWVGLVFSGLLLIPTMSVLDEAYKCPESVR